MGTLIVGAVVSTAWATTTTAGIIISGAITGAMIGAAVGGIGAAIQGGDILKGVLYGAVGGAVLGGLSGYISTLGTGLSGVSGGTGNVIEVGADGLYHTENGLVLTGGDQILANTPKGQSLLATEFAKNSGNVLSGVTKDGLLAAGTGAVGQLGEMLMADSAADSAANLARETAAETAKTRKEEMELANKYALEQIAARGSAGGGSDALSVAQSNQAHDLNVMDINRRNEAEDRARRSATIRGLKVGGDRAVAAADVKAPQAWETALDPALLAESTEVVV